MQLKTDITGMITINSNNPKVHDFLVNALKQKQTIGVVDFNDVSDEENLAIMKDKNFKLSTILDFTAIGEPTLRDSLINLKEKLEKTVNSDSNKSEAYNSMLNDKWTVIVDFSERENENEESNGSYGICNGLDDHDFEVIDLLENA